MKVMFIGATHEVTGSCTYIEACGKKFLVDFGMEQGLNAFDNVKVPCAPGEIDFVLLTHAHIDHSGLLPLLCAGGFKGQIHCQSATANLCSIMLRDSAHIQEFEAEWRSRKGKRKGKQEVEPLYTMSDAELAIRALCPHEYEQPVKLGEGISALFRDAGHLLGSSGIEITLTEEGQTRTIIFSGDIGNTDIPLIRDPQYFSHADYAVMESTYGNRFHEKPADYPTWCRRSMMRRRMRERLRPRPRWPRCCSVCCWHGCAGDRGISVGMRLGGRSADNDRCLPMPPAGFLFGYHPYCETLRLQRLTMV